MVMKECFFVYPLSILCLSCTVWLFCPSLVFLGLAVLMPSLHSFSSTVCVEGIFFQTLSFYKDTHYIGLAPTLIAST